MGMWEVLQKLYHKREQIEDNNPIQALKKIKNSEMKPQFPNQTSLLPLNQ